MMNTRMSTLEKRFVNARRHSDRVAQQAVWLAGRVVPPPGAHYLDVGTGNGAAVRAVAETYGLIATGVDVDPAQIALAQAAAHGRSDVHFETADAADLPFPDASFDLVASARMTHHLPNWPAALREIVRVLKPGGYLIYTDFVLAGWLARLLGGLVRRPVPPNCAGLRVFTARYGLEPVFRRRGMMLTVIWHKPAAEVRR